MLGLLAFLFSAAVVPLVGANPLIPRDRDLHWSSRSLPFDTSSLPRSTSNTKRQAWELTQPGTTGVAAMQMVVISPTQILFVDRVEHNPLQIDGHNAWSAVYSLATNAVRPVSLLTNSFCAGGSWLSNGTLLNVGGNLAEQADIPDLNGWQGIRLFNPSSCPDSPSGSCSFYESPQRIRLSIWRWYPSAVRLDDGSMMIIGGSASGAFSNNATLNVPSIEFWPPKNVNGFNGIAVPMKFLNDTLNANLFPHAIVLPAGRVFIAANRKAMIYDWRQNLEIRLPDVPNGVRFTYPMAGTAVLLPLTAANNYAPTILICGGSASSDTVPSPSLSSQDPASAQCARMELTVNGIRAGWLVEIMPEPRLMPDAVILPDGRILIVNGARTGYSGYGNVNNRVGLSNADNPVFRPVIYDPTAPVGSRFSTTGLPTSGIARMYHSVASLLPDASIAIAGSNPNPDITTVKYATEYRLEILRPPYMAAGVERPTFTGAPALANWGTVLTLTVTLPPGTQVIQAAMLDLGYSTHAVHMDMRHVWLPTSLVNATTLQVTTPPNFTVYPPGPGWLFILADGVPSVGKRMIMGSGAGPRVDNAAWLNMLNKTHNPF